MRKNQIVIAIAMSVVSSYAIAEEKVLEQTAKTLTNFWEKSNWEGLVSIGSHHERGYYGSYANRLNERNEGYGIGLVYKSEASNEHSIKYLRISDSNYQTQHLLGYQYMYNIFKKDVDLQIGFMGGITKRDFYRKNKSLLIPFVLPAFGLKMWNVKLNATYVPRLKFDGEKYGGFGYMWATYEFK